MLSYNLFLLKFRSAMRPWRSLPTPVNISGMWNFGSLLGFMLVVQIVSGLLLASHYLPSTAGAFDSVAHVMRDVQWGWWLRSMHSNGASFFFLFLYLHMGRGLYFGSYSMVGVWLSGCALFLLLMLTAFLGYVLVWGQMSYWAATVITSLLSAVPGIGDSLLKWVWGGFAVGDPTLRRFFVLHFLLPFVMAVLSGGHMLLLHKDGSSNPLGINGDVQRVGFHPYYTWKDVLGVLGGLWILGAVMSFYPNAFLAPENFIPANPLVTPTHIMPEWYFLWAYAVLRSVPSKLGGLGILLLVIVWLVSLPFFVWGLGLSDVPVSLSVLKSGVFWVMVSSFAFLTWLGSCPAQEPYASATFGVVCFMFALLYFFLVVDNAVDLSASCLVVGLKGCLVGVLSYAM